jgi:hypothetical protein
VGDLGVVPVEGNHVPVISTGNINRSITDADYQHADYQGADSKSDLEK